MSENGVEKIVIIGSGPAGWTAALYAARADLNPLLFEGAPTQEMIPGGQLMFTTDVENFPGYPEGVTGQQMMADFKAQGERFGTRVVTDDIVKCEFDKHPFVLHSREGYTVEAHTVIISTGAKAKWLVARERAAPGPVGRRRARPAPYATARSRASAISTSLSWAAGTPPWRRPTSSPSSPAR